MGIPQLSPERLLDLANALTYLYKIRDSEADKANGDLYYQSLVYLKHRWTDESEYEDFNEYIETAKKRLESWKDFEFQKMTKRPFVIFGKIYGFPVQIGLRNDAIYVKHPPIPKKS
jgi:hypothetical protein